MTARAPLLHVLAFAPLAVWGGVGIARRRRGLAGLGGALLALVGAAAFVRGVVGLREAESGGLLPGGRGDRLRPEDVDPAELARGVVVEREHTTDAAIATEIALDHLAEDPHYYTKLAAVHLD